jgi:hypothetical protein
VRPLCLDGPYTVILSPTVKGPVDGDIVSMFFDNIGAARK